MRPRVGPHVLVLVWTGIALAQPAPAPQAAVPEWTPGPATFAVTPFENHVLGGKSLEWIVAEAPFEIAEKTINVLGLDGVGGPLYVPGERVPAEADTVHDFGKKLGATFVITGWFDRIGDQLRLVVLVWKRDQGTAKVVGEAKRMGPMTAYHRVLGEAMGEAWGEAGITVDVARREKLSRALATDIYPVFMMGRGLGHFTGALAAMSSVFGTGGGSGAIGPDLKAAEHDLERAVFLDPKLYPAQRLLGELYLATAGADGKRASKATGKFNYAADLAPDDVPSLRAAALAMARASKHEVALDLFRRLVTLRPWDLDARYHLGSQLWHVGESKDAERQLEQVTARIPDHLPSRRVLVLIHSSSGDTQRLIRELEAIAKRVSTDLEVKSDLATAYGSIGRWDKAIRELDLIVRDHPTDLPVFVRLGDAYRNNKQLELALAWYQRAARLDPDTTFPGFAAAQALFDAGRYADAIRNYQLLQKGGDQAAAEHALGAIALLQNRGDDAAWYLRKASRALPRSLVTRRALVAAEVMRRDTTAAFAHLDHALATWPNDGTLRYLSGLAHHIAGDNVRARSELELALKHEPRMAAVRAALTSLGSGAPLVLDFKPDIVRPWGDGDALQVAIDRFNVTSTALATIRVEYQAHLLALLGALGKGPSTKIKPGAVKTCPLSQLATSWEAAQKALSRYARLGVELEQTYRYIARHDEIGMTGALMPSSRTAAAKAKRSYRVALADLGELRAEWTRGLGPELRALGCTEKLLVAAIKDPLRYRVIREDKPEAIPTRPPPRPKPRTTFFVDNTRCADPVDVWIDGSHVGQVVAGRRSALVADGGERTLCLLIPGGAQCGDRGTVRQVYLHDGWATTMHCVVSSK